MRERIRALPAFLGFAALGAAALWLALSGLVPTARALIGRAPLVALSPRDVIGLPLGLLCFALAGMTLVPAPASGSARDRRRTPDARRTRAMTLCLAAAMAGVLLTVVAVPVTELTAAAVMAHRHYLRCPTPLRERHPPLRWSLPDARCP